MGAAVTGALALTTLPTTTWGRTHPAAQGMGFSHFYKDEPNAY